MPTSTSRRRRIALAAFLAGAVVTASACSSSDEGPASPSGTSTVRIALTTGTTSAEIADAEGYFAEHGLNVEIIPLATGTETLAAVQGGSADVAYADTFAAVNAIDNGFDIDLVAGANYTSPAMSYLVRDDSDIREPADLAGKNLGIGGVPFFRVFANGFLSANTLSTDAVNVTIVRQSNALPEALANGSVDAIQSLGYQVAYQNDGQGHRFRSVGDPDTSAFQNPNAMQAGWWTSGTWAEKNAETADKFADAYRAFATWYNGLDANARAELAVKYNDIDYKELAAGDPAKLDNLAFYTVARYIDAPVDVDATQDWIEKGHTAAPDQVPDGVGIAEHISPSAS